MLPLEEILRYAQNDLFYLVCRLFFSAGVRVSGGHLCEAEAPTEPTGETQDPALPIVYKNLFSPTNRSLWGMNNEVLLRNMK